jgi:hypothetical protein
MTAAFPEEPVHKLAKDYLLAKSAFNLAYCRFWQAEVVPCRDEIGWNLLGGLQKQVEEYCFRLKRGEVAIKQAAWEIFRLELVGEAEYSWGEAAGFVKWFQMLKRKIHHGIRHLYDFHGDSFADLVDSFPLAGRDLVDRALASHPKSQRPRREGYLAQDEIENSVREKLGLDWHRLICEGENYVEAALERACRRSYLDRVLTGRDERVCWTEEEKIALTFAGHYDE